MSAGRAVTFAQTSPGWFVCDQDPTIVIFRYFAQDRERFMVKHVGRYVRSSRTLRGAKRIAGNIAREQFALDAHAEARS